MTSASPRVVCLLDCDNTLLNNDALKDDLSAKLLALLGPERAARFWALYEETRHEEGTVDFPETVARFRPLVGDGLAEQVRHVIWDDAFASYLYPASLLAVAHLWSIGCNVGIVSDGDAEYQPHKIRESGLAAAVQGQVQIYIHKQAHLDEIFAALPGDQYVMIDDKATILADFKRLHPERFTTIHVQQGHYGPIAATPPADTEVGSIGDLLGFDLARLTRTVG
jgi:FMN phosphatase YigB (HAD superfamily)